MRLSSVIKRSLSYYWRTNVPVILGVATAGAILTGALLVRLFIFFHDCVHGSFFPGRAANTFFGHLLGLLAFTPLMRSGTPSRGICAAAPDITTSFGRSSTPPPSSAETSRRRQTGRWTSRGSRDHQYQCHGRHSPSQGRPGPHRRPGAIR